LIERLYLLHLLLSNENPNIQWFNRIKGMVNSEVDENLAGVLAHDFNKYCEIHLSETTFTHEFHINQLRCFILLILGLIKREDWEKALLESCRIGGISTPNGFAFEAVQIKIDPSIQSLSAEEWLIIHTLVLNCIKEGRSTIIIGKDQDSLCVRQNVVGTPSDFTPQPIEAAINQINEKISQIYAGQTKMNKIKVGILINEIKKILRNTLTRGLTMSALYAYLRYLEYLEQRTKTNQELNLSDIRQGLNNVLQYFSGTYQGTEMEGIRLRLYPNNSFSQSGTEM